MKGFLIMLKNSKILLHIAFVKLIKNQYNLIENQENKKIRKRKNNNPDFSNKNSTVIYIKEQYL